MEKHINIDNTISQEHYRVTAQQNQGEDSGKNDSYEPLINRNRVFAKLIQIVNNKVQIIDWYQPEA